MDREGGVAWARWASLQKEPHSRRTTKATWASWAPTSSSLHSSVLALPHLFEMKLVQNSKRDTQNIYIGRAGSFYLTWETTYIRGGEHLTLREIDQQT